MESTMWTIALFLEAVLQGTSGASSLALSAGLPFTNMQDLLHYVDNGINAVFTDECTLYHPYN